MSLNSSSTIIFTFWLILLGKVWTPWRQHPTRHQLYGHLPPIMKTIQVRWIRHAGHCWRSKDEFISDVLLWTPAYGQAKAGRPAQIYIQQLCEDTGCNPEDLPKAMSDREEWRERVRDIHAGGTTHDDELNSTTILLQGWFWHQITQKVDMSLKKETYSNQLRWAKHAGHSW